MSEPALASYPVDVLVTAGTVATLAAKAVTSTLPIVMVSAGDPVQTRLVANLARPGQNITGLTNTTPELTWRRLDLLLAVVPDATRVAVLWNGANPGNGVYFKEVETAAQHQGVRLQSLQVRTAADLERVLARAARDRAEALLVAADSAIVDQAQQVVDYAAANRQPALYPSKRFVDVGGLMALGPNLDEMFRRSAVYVDKILRGAKPANLPVERPREFELTVNVRAAEAIGLALPEPVLAQATELLP